MPIAVPSLSLAPVRVSLILLAMAPACATTALFAQQAGGSQPRAQVAAQAPAPPTLVEDRDAHETRERLQEVLRKQVPALGRVLKLDPSLLSNADYLAAYPALQAFLADHPEVAHNPAFFLERVAFEQPDVPTDARAQAVRLWGNLMDALGAFAIFLVVVVTLMWLTRTFIDYRRWSRVARVQAEVHAKLLDRFAANEDLLAYIRTGPGTKFLESAPIPLDGESRTPAPLNRILWSVQAGLVLGAGGVGLMYLSGRLPEEVGAPAFALGVLGIAIGFGFILAAGAAYVLSRQLGLVPQAAAATADRDVVR
jgi:hypothetical protein